MDKSEKIEDLEENLAKWEKEEPTCDLGISLKLKVIAGLKKDIEALTK
jgi:hypothetical protein